MWKVTAISLIICFVLLCVAKTMMANMSPSEKIDAGLFGRYPFRVGIVSIIWLLSAIETVIVAIVWIVKA